MIQSFYDSKSDPERFWEDKPRRAAPEVGKGRPRDLFAVSGIIGLVVLVNLAAIAVLVLALLVLH